MSLLSTVLKALLKSSEVRWVYGRSRAPSRARSTARTTGSTPPLLPTPNWYGSRKSRRLECRTMALVASL
jgi:hypothetical protein